jgi:hypothetical protein
MGAVQSCGLKGRDPPRTIDMGLAVTTARRADYSPLWEHDYNHQRRNKEKQRNRHRNNWIAFYNETHNHWSWTKILYAAIWSAIFTMLLTIILAHLSCKNYRVPLPPNKAELSLEI